MKNLFFFMFMVVAGCGGLSNPSTPSSPSASALQIELAKAAAASPFMLIAQSKSPTPAPTPNPGPEPGPEPPGLSELIEKAVNPIKEEVKEVKKSVNDLKEEFQKTRDAINNKVDDLEKKTSALSSDIGAANKVNAQIVECMQQWRNGPPVYRAVNKKVVDKEGCYIDANGNEVCPVKPASQSPQNGTPVDSLGEESGQIEWKLSSKEVREEALKTGKPILVYWHKISDGGCPWCNKLESDVFANPDVASYVREYFIPISFDDTQLKNLTPSGREKWNVRSYPTCQCINSKWSQIHVIERTYDPEVFLRRLKESVDWAEHSEVQELLKKTREKSSSIYVERPSRVVYREPFYGGWGYYGGSGCSSCGGGGCFGGNCFGGGCRGGCCGGGCGGW